MKRTLAACGDARDSWITSSRGKVVLGGAAIAAAAAGALLTLFAAPLTPVAILGVGLAGVGGLPGIAAVVENWKSGKREGGGLSYLLCKPK